MGKYLRFFSTHSQYEAFIETEDFLLPNVSCCEDQINDVHYNPIAPQETRLMVTYNVEDASNPTQLYTYMVQEGAPFSIRGVDMFDKVEIDGTEVSVANIDSASGAYQLSSGEHTIAYTLKDPTFIGVELDEQTKIPTKVGAIFMQCTTITSAQIPNSVTSVGDSAFQFCSGLTSVTIGSGVTSIGNSAFIGCSGITSVIIPDSVTSIGVQAFGGCESLTSITVDSNNTVYDSRNNCNAIIETSTNTLLTGCKNTVIPNTVTSISDGAFYGCSGLTSVTIGSGVTSIGDGAFGDCSDLTSITIPNSVTSIGNYAFDNCSSLTSITCNPTTPPTLGNGTFDYTNNCPIYVPSETVETYKAASNWSTYASRIQPIT